MKARVFISHSCKDAKARQPLAASGTADARTQEVLAYARNVRGRVVRKLERKGFEVWLDKTGLEPGEDWRAKLHRWIGTCDAAVILLDAESVQSPWLLKEATILAWRRDIGANVTVVPALLGDFKAGDISSSALRPIALDWSQSARIDATDRSDASAEQLAKRIARSIERVTRGEPRTDMERWIRKVRGILDQVERDPYLLDAAERLGIGDAEWGDAGDADAGLTATLAHHVLYATLDATLDALEDIRDGVPAGRFGTLVDLVRPVWVDARAAQCLNAFVGELPPPVIVLAARKLETAARFAGNYT